METTSDVISDSIYGHSQFQAFFKTSRQSLILKANAPHFTIIAVSDHYLFLTHKQRNEVLHRNIFEVFPGSDIDISQQGKVYDSFMRVIKTGEKDVLPVFIYEIDNPQTGERELQYWSNVNEPLLDEKGDVAYLVNTTANITAQVLGDAAITDSTKHKADLTLAHKQNQRLAADNLEQRRLHEELKTTYGREQILIEELSASNEKMKAFNEELLSSNEHLQGAYDYLASINTKLNLTEERLRLSTEAANIGTFTIEIGTGKFAVSDRTCEIFGITNTADLSLDDFTVLMDNAHRNRVTKAINKSIALNNAAYFEEYAIIRKKDGSKRWVRALGNTRASGEDKIPIFAGVVIDITDHKEDEHRRNEFIEMVAFNLKTPLTSLSGLLHILQMKNESSDETTFSLFEKGKQQINRMTDTINNFLDNLSTQIRLH